MEKFFVVFTSPSSVAIAALLRPPPSDGIFDTRRG
jgi:hypothetical protein